MAELPGMDEPRGRFAAMMSGLHIDYDLGEGHPLPGRRMPDLDLVTDNGSARRICGLGGGTRPGWGSLTRSPLGSDRASRIELLRLRPARGSKGILYSR